MTITVPPRIWLQRLWICVVAIFLITVGRGVRAQYAAVGYPGSLPIATSVDSLADEFHLGKPEQREDLLRRLGVDASLAHPAAASLSGTGIRTEALPGTGASLLFLPCGDTGQPASLFLLRPTPGQAWKTVSSVSLDCWWQASTYELLTVPGQTSPLILAHHVNHGHGSGMVQDDMLLLGVRGDRLDTLLQIPEYLSEETLGTDVTTEHKSTLQPLPDGTLEETRSVSVLDPPGNPGQQARLTVVERRHWRWNKASRRFVASQFLPVRS